MEAAFPDRNFGGESKLVADQSPERESYLRFNVRVPESTNGVDFVSTNGSAYSLFPRLILDTESAPYCTYQGEGGGLTGWTRHYGGAGPERLHAMASDSQGGFVAAGLFGSAATPRRGRPCGPAM